MCRKAVFLFVVLLFIAIDAQAMLIAHYTFEGNAKDVSGYQPADGTLQGGPTFTAGPTGFGQSLRLGTNKYVDCGNADKLTIRNAITVMCWAKVSSWLSAGYDPLITKGAATCRLQRWSNTDTMVWGAQGVTGVPTYGFYIIGTTNVNDGQWHHFAGVYDGSNVTLYVDGKVDATSTATGMIDTTTSNMWIGGNSGSTTRFWDGWIDDVRIYDTGFSQAEINDAMMDLTSPQFASNPKPSDKAQDIARNEVLSWKSGDFSNTHNVFFGTDINDVNNATIGNSLGVTVSAGQPLDVNYFNPGSLEFGKTYYWRVDEVNAPSKPGTFKGQVWQFTVGPAALKVPAANIKATAKHSAANNDPNNTINEKGFKDANNPDWHDISLGMWLSGKTDVNNPVWIMYEFSELYKIHEMFVWNHNAKIGTGKSGFKSTIIEYSEDGQAWTQLTTTQFNRGPGRIDYVYNTTVPFNGAVAKYVRITALSNWNGDQNGSGLSEVRFTYIPVRARKPSPDTGSVNVPLNKVLTWRAGRDAVTHNVYISTNEQSVTSRSSGVHTVSQAVYTPSSGLELNRTYYWRVDEVNTLEVPSLWETDVWSFSTPAYILVEGFETGYDDSDANAVWATWTGWEDLTNGGAMGNPGIPYLSTTNHSGGHSSPMFYNNGKAGVVKSEVIAQTANLPIGTTNWTLGNPDTLVIWFRGDPNNPVTDKMYVKLNSTKVIYNGSVSDITRTAWTKWEVPLAGINLGNISSLTIGLEKIGSTGGPGVLYMDDIQLTISVPASDPGTANLIAKYNMENNVQDSSGSGLNGTAYAVKIFGDTLIEYVNSQR